MKSNGFARPDEGLIDKVHKGHLRTGPRAPGFGTMVEGANARAGVGPTGPMPARPTRDGTPCAVATVTGSCERPTRHQPLRAWEKRGGRLIANGGDQAEPAGSRKQDHPQPANTGNCITGPRKPPCPI
ncbi:MAG: hypothetical protein GDA36_00710 [Rhodobacteraceae bacterium]|nr:hypothetical protein [Paracoccaceae bacterium]